jgi:hypothetical protein
MLKFTADHRERGKLNWRAEELAAGPKPRRPEPEPTPPEPEPFHRDPEPLRRDPEPFQPEPEPFHRDPEPKPLKEQTGGRKPLASRKRPCNEMVRVSPSFFVAGMCRSRRNEEQGRDSTTSPAPGHPCRQTEASIGPGSRRPLPCALAGLRLFHRGQGRPQQGVHFCQRRIALVGC